MSRFIACLGLATCLWTCQAALPPYTAITSDTSGNIWVTGYWSAASQVAVPVTANAFQPKPFETSCGGYEERNNWIEVSCNDAFVIEFDPSGTKVLYATYLGGTGEDDAVSIAASPAGGVYVVGYTGSTDFPVTSGAVQTVNHGPFIVANGPFELLRQGDVFITKFNPDGSIAYSTFLGGTGTDIPTQIMVDSNDFAYVAGYTYSTDFPVTASSFSHTPSRGFLAKINPTGSVLVFSTYYPGEISGLAVDAAGATYITTTQGFGTEDAFVSKISAAGDRAIYNDDLGVWPLSMPIVVDSTGQVWVGLDVLLQISPDGSRINKGFTEYPTNAYALAIDAENNVYVMGVGTIQTTTNAVLASPCAQNLFILELTSSGDVVYASYLRQPPLLTLLVTAPGQVLLGLTERLDLTRKPSLNFGCPVNAASLMQRYVAPGEIVTLFGYGLGPRSGVAASPDANGRIPTTLAGVQVLVNDVPAPILYAQDGQINAVMPTNPDIRTITVTYNQQSAPALELPFNYNDPGVFAVLNQDGSENSPSNPAAPGSILQCYMTGLGLNPAAVPEDGTIIPLTPLTTLGYSPSATFVLTKPGGRETIQVSGDVTWAGLAPGLVLGVEQVNIRIPPEISKERFTGSASLVLSNYPILTVNYPTTAVNVAIAPARSSTIKTATLLY